MQSWIINKTKKRAAIWLVPGLAATICSIWALTVYAAGFPFFSKQGDVPHGAYWFVTNDHGTNARDLVLKRWTGSKWTVLKEGISDADYQKNPANETQMTFGMPVYAVADEVMTCWRNAPENPNANDAVTPERDGCVDEDKDGNPCEYYKTCSCQIPRAGNHVNVRMADGQVILYAHFKQGSIPASVCPKTASLVADARDSNTSGPNGFLPEIWIPAGRRPKITAGQFLGLAGNTGASGGPHLHIHQASCDKHDGCPSVPLLFNGISVSNGVDGTKDASGQKWKFLSPAGALSGPPQLIRFGQVISQ